jgi:resuscitation-promoting factor RpfB
MQQLKSYYLSLNNWRFLCLIALLALILPACTPQTSTPQIITITVRVDGKDMPIEIQPGATVQDVLEKAEVKLSNLDRVDPPDFTILVDSLTIQVTRIREEFSVEESQIEFEYLTVRNESLPEGQKLQIQKGVPGKKQVTYRQMFENDVPGPRTEFKTETLQEPLPEITMVGVQTPFTAVSFSGKLVYLTAGNAWLMEESTANRRPLITTGDLDGRIFTLSLDAQWLLFSRKSDEENVINTLWALDITSPDLKPIDLRVKNVVHFAAWRPGKTLTLAYSTVEPRSAPPGWQANNDLYTLKINADGVIINKEKIIEENYGGVYGWWGTDFAWTPDGEKMAYANSDSVGLVNFETGKLDPLVSLIPYNTRSEWAWVPGICWSADQSILYSVTHQPMTGVDNNDTSPIFDLSAFIFETDSLISLVPQTGMFAYPSCSPNMQDDRFRIAYLQALSIDRSDNSRYRLITIDRDGSNRQVLFPEEGAAGLEPQRVVWAPYVAPDLPSWIGVIYQGNLWLIDAKSGITQKITGDGSINRIDWK